MERQDILEKEEGVLTPAPVSLQDKALAKEEIRQTFAHKSYKKTHDNLQQNNKA